MIDALLIVINFWTVFMFQILNRNLRIYHILRNVIKVRPNFIFGVFIEAQEFQETWNESSFCGEKIEYLRHVKL